MHILIGSLKFLMSFHQSHCSFNPEVFFSYSCSMYIKLEFVEASIPESDRIVYRCLIVLFCEFNKCFWFP